MRLVPPRLPAFHRICFVLLLAAGSCGAQTISDALETPGLTWNNPAGTLIQNDVTFDGVDAVRLTRTAASPLRTTLTGPQRFAVKVRTSTEQDADFFELAVDGVVVTRLSGEQSWQEVSAEIPPGSHTLDLTYKKDAGIDDGADAVWVDAVKMTPLTIPSMSEALDLPPALLGLTLSLQSVELIPSRLPLLTPGREDVLLLRPITPPGTGSALLRLPVSGRGILTLYTMPYGASLMGNPFEPVLPLRQDVDPSTYPGGIFSRVDFLQPLDVPAATVELLIQMPPSGVLLDAVQWTPLPAVSVAEALDTPGRTWQPGGAVMAVASATESSDGEDAVIFYDSGAYLITTVTGPANVTCRLRNAPDVAVDGTLASPVVLESLPGGWNRVLLGVPAGEHQVRWRNRGDRFTSLSGQGRVDSLTVQSTAGLTLAQALDGTGFNWTTSPGSAIIPTAVPPNTADGVDAVAGFLTGQWLETPSGEGGLLQFAWRGALSLHRDGTEVIANPLIATDPWFRVACDAPPAVPLRWAANNNSSSVAKGLDMVSLTPGTPATLNAIAEVPAGVSIRYAAGKQSAGPVDAWQGEPGRQILMELNPQFAVQLPAGSGVLGARVWLPDKAVLGSVTSSPFVTLDSYVGTGQWQDVAWNVNQPPGRAGVAVLKGPDLATLALDRFTWTTGSLYSATEAMDLPGVTWTTSLTGNTEGWLGRPTPWPAINPGDGDAMVVPLLSPGETATISTSLPAGGWLSWSRYLPSSAKLTLTVNGNNAGEFTGASTWVRDYVLLDGAGPFNISLTLSSMGATVSGSAVHDVKLLPWAEISGAPAGLPPNTVIRTSPHRPCRPIVDIGSTDHPDYLSLRGNLQRCVLEMDAAGPGIWSFDASGDGGSSVDPPSVGTPGATAGWQRNQKTFLTPGPHRIRWTTGVSGETKLDNITFTPLAFTTAGEALDQPALAWTAGPEWTGFASAPHSHDGTDALGFTGHEIGALLLPFPGRGLVSFWWRPDVSFTVMRFEGPGVDVSGSPDTQWQRVWAAFPDSPGTPLRWTVTPRSDYGGTASAWIDEVQFIPFNNATLAEVLDTPGRTWTTAPNGWFGADNAAGAGDAADFAVARPSTTPLFIETTVTPPVWVEYDTPALPGANAVTLAAGSQPAAAYYPPAVPGALRTRALFTGPGNIVRLNAVPGAVPSVVDRVFIGSTVNVAEAMDAPGLSWTVIPNNSTAGVKMTEAFSGGDAAVLSIPGRAGVSLATTVTGPGRLAFHWKGEGELTTAAAAGLEVDGVIVLTIFPGTSWRNAAWPVPAGSHTIKIMPLSGSYVLADNFRFQPDAEDPAAAALDAPALSFGGSGEVWEPVANPDATGGTAMQAGAAAGSLAATVNGPGSIAFRYRLHTGAPSASLTLFVNGTAAWQGTPAAEWTPQAIPLTDDGPHRVEWVWSGGAAADLAMLDAVSLTPFGAVSVPPGVDAETLDFTVPAGWQGVSGAAAGVNGGDGARFVSGSLGTYRMLSTTVTGPAQLSFRWYLAAQARGMLSFEAGTFPNVSWILSPSALYRWEQVTVGVPAGTHALRWISAGADTPASGLVDDITVTPLNLPATLAEHVDLTGMIVSADAVWKPVSAPALRDADALLCTDAFAYLTFEVNGPGLLECAIAAGDNNAPSVSIVSDTSPGDFNVTQSPEVTPSTVPGINWRHFTINSFGSGTKKILLRPSHGQSAAGPFVVDDCRWTPVTTVSLTEALDTPGYNWTTGGTATWTGQSFLGNPPNGTPVDLTQDVAVLQGMVNSGGAWAETTIAGPFSLTSVPVGLANYTFHVDGKPVDDAETPFFVTTPGPHVLRLSNGSLTSSSSRIAIDRVLITPLPDLRTGIGAGALDMTFDPGVWRTATYLSRPGDVMLSLPTPGIGATLKVEGPGMLEFFADGAGTVSTGPEFTVRVLNYSRGTLRLEFPAPGPRTVRFMPSSTTTPLYLSSFVWTAGAAPYCAAADITRDAWFQPANEFFVMSGGKGLGFSNSNFQSGHFAIANSGPSLVTWWQNIPPDNPPYSSPLTAISLPFSTVPITPATAAEAGPLPAVPQPSLWSAAKMQHPSGPSGIHWELTNSGAFAGIRIQPSPIAADTALDLPAGITATAPAAFGTAMATGRNGNVTMLLPSVEDALQCTVTGPGILSFTAGVICEGTAVPAKVSVRVDNLPPAPGLDGRCHVLIEPGPHTLSFSSAPGSAICLDTVDAVEFLPLSFAPATALGAPAQTLAVTSATAPSAWTFVTSGGTSGLALSSTVKLVTSTLSPAWLEMEMSGPVSVNTVNTNLVENWSAGTGRMWCGGKDTLVFSGSGGASLSRLTLRHAPPSAVSVAEALDNSTLTFIPGDGCLPHVLTERTFDGVDAVAFPSNRIPRSLQTTLTGPGKLRFRWRALNTSSPAFIVSIDNTTAASAANGPWKTVELPITAGTHTVRWSGSSVASAELDTVEWFPSHTFATWAAGYPALAPLSANDRAASDSDGDGVPALLEYSLGLDPTRADAGFYGGSILAPDAPPGLPSVVIGRGLDGKNYLDLIFARRVNAGLTWQMQATAEPAAAVWQNTGSLEVLRPLDPNTELCRIRDSQAFDAAGPRRFVRLRVTQP